MKKPGIIIRDTVLHLPQSVLDDCDELYGEPEYLKPCWDRIIRDSDISFHPMISGYLGAKTQACKTDETEYISGGNHSGALYFFDAKNIRFNEWKLFHEEIRAAEAVLSDPGSAVYLPVGFFTGEETGQILRGIDSLACRVMAFFSDELVRSERLTGILSDLTGRRSSSGIICAFSSLQLLNESEQALLEAGIEETAYYS